MSTAVDQMRVALGELSTERLQRLVDRLERNPDVKVTVGSWHPQCPMVLAGFDPVGAEARCPEQCFAEAWDRFAKTEPGTRWQAILWPAPRSARRSDVQLLLRSASAALAGAGSLSRGPKPPGVSRHQRASSSDSLPLSGLRP